ncbi:uncharacterized protein LOC114216808 [Eumetopias jubatus]|uniref:uncharacterized protein LOC114216808 n=1 Tax=Eumetopias jubatus TaxID=34886 RepID=UPI0010167460|nr:uncharacterized protein LOC114216808 [Eumetopias jubatus]
MRCVDICSHYTCTLFPDHTGLVWKSALNKGVLLRFQDFRHQRRVILWKQTPPETCDSGWLFSPNPRLPRPRKSRLTKLLHCPVMMMYLSASCPSPSLKYLLAKGAGMCVCFGNCCVCGLDKQALNAEADHQNSRDILTRATKKSLGWREKNVAITGGGIKWCLECRDWTGAPWRGLVRRGKGSLGEALGNSRISSFGELGEDRGGETSGGSGFSPTPGTFDLWSLIRSHLVLVIFS